MKTINDVELEIVEKKVSLTLQSQIETKDYLNKQICPLCHRTVEQSTYLQEIFEGEPATLWLANLVTHYRHNHITSWNKCWGNHGNYYRSKWFGDYDEEKSVVNERAKRQLVRKGYVILFENGVTPETFKNLENTSQETFDLANKYYQKFQISRLSSTKSRVSTENL